MENIIVFSVAIAAGVACHYIIKGLYINHLTQKFLKQESEIRHEVL